MLLPHLPWIYCRPASSTSAACGLRSGESSELGAFDRSLVRLSYLRHMLQVAAVDNAVGT